MARLLPVQRLTRDGEGIRSGAESTQMNACWLDRRRSVPTAAAGPALRDLPVRIRNASFRLRLVFLERIGEGFDCLPCIGHQVQARDRPVGTGAIPETTPSV